MNTTDQINLARAEAIASLETTIANGEADLRRAREMVDNIHRKQAARRQELGYQKARAGMKLSKVRDTPITGGIYFTPKYVLDYIKSNHLSGIE